MADITITDLLQKIIKNIHVLHEFTTDEEDVSSYEALLRETMVDIHQLLGLHNIISQEIILRVDPKVSIGSLSILSNSSKNSIAGDIGSDIVSVIQAIQRGSQGTKSDIIRSMVKLLADNKLNLDDRRPKRVRSSFSGIFIKLANLIDFFTRIREEAEEEIIIYVNRCFNYEAMFYSYLSNRINGNLRFNDEDAERLVTTLDKIIERDTPKEEDMVENTSSSIFSYESADRDYYDSDNVSKIPLRFHSSDTSFEQLYQIFFRSLCLKEAYINGQHIHKDYTKYIRIMLKTFKSSRHIDYFELNDFEKREEKYKKFYEFFVGKTDEKSGLLPEFFNQSNFKVLEHMNLIPELGTQPDSEANLFSNQEYPRKNANIDLETASRAKKSSYDILLSKSNRSHLIRCLHYLISLLNEFELNLDLNFPHLFNYYALLVFNEMPDSVDSSDRLYIERVNYVSARLMELDDENVKADEPQVKETVYFFCRLVNQLSEIKEGKKISCTILMILANYEYKKVAADAKSVLNKWNDLMLGVVHLNHNLLNTWYPLRDRRTTFSVLREWYNKYRRWENVGQVTGKLVDQTSCFDIFIKRWLVKVKNAHSLGYQAHLFTMRRIFSNWNRKSFKLSKLLDKAVTFERSMRLKRFLWKPKHETIKKLAEMSDAFLMHSQLSKGLLVRKHVFLIWYERLNNLINQTLYALRPMHSSINGDSWYLVDGIETFKEKLSKLVSTEKHFLLSKFFEKYRKAHQIEVRVFSFRQRQQLIFIAYIFNKQWLRKLALRQKLRYLSSEKDLTMKTNFFFFWKDSKELNSTARKFRNGKIWSHYFARWKINYLLSFNYLRRTSLSLLPIKTIFSKWIMLHTSNSFIGKACLNTEKLIFESWASKYNNTQLLLSRAMSFDGDSLRRQNIMKMLLRHKKFLRMRNVADLNIQRKHFNLLCSKQYLFSTKYASIAMQKCANLNFNDKVSLLTVYSLWLSRYEVLQEERNESLLEIYQNFLRENFKKRILECWVVSYDRIQYLTMELNNKCEQFSKRSLLLRKIFNNWVTRKNETMQLSLTCYNFERQILLKKFIFIWYTQFTESAYLYDLYDDFVGQKEYATLREFLSIWNMKYIKDVKRNQQSCGLFVKRGEIALLRSVFELWHYKVKNFNNINNPSDTIIDSERSINSNPSPLANKSSRKSYNFVTNEGNDHFKSYLNTPLKTDTIYTPFTPRFSQNDRISPTKLQETTTRAKNSRIDALRKHFSKARATSTPRARQQLLDNRKKSEAGLLDKNSKTFVHLSPPQKAFSDNIYPPSRPNFSESIFATQVNNGLSSVESPEATHTTVDEKSLIATAKQMRRITPIYIPVEEEGLQPRISPVRKLKEKLKGDVSGTIN